MIYPKLTYSWYRAKIPEIAPTGEPTEEFTEATEAPVEEPDYNAKLGDGKTLCLLYRGNGNSFKLRPSVYTKWRKSSL